MKIYKHYFNKEDTPYVQTYQSKKAYHTVWKHYAYKEFLKHYVMKVKLFGLFTIYKQEEQVNE